MRSISDINNDSMKQEIELLQSSINDYRMALHTIMEYGGRTSVSEFGMINCTGSWCAEQARMALRVE